MMVLGLTGSAAMGKSTVAAMFAEAGVPVFDADGVVHALYAGEAVPLVEAAFPGVTRDGAVDRAALRKRVLGDDAAMQKLEGLVHPLVRAREAAFREHAAKAGARLIVLDIPLLFETAADSRAHAVAVVSAPAEVQRARLRERGLDDAAVRALLARQMPDAEKRRRAHFVIDTGTSLEATRRAAGDVLRALAGAA